VAFVTAARNEGPHVEHFLGALDRLEYPRESLFVVLVDDGSDDDTGERLSRWAADHRALFVGLPAQAGKAAALNEGIAAAPASDLVAICDADLRPRPDWLHELAGSFADPAVASASGPLLPCNAEAGPVARYAAVESWVHQLVTAAGKDRLELNPPAHGASLYRREALQEIGLFASAWPGEDVRATMALTRAGWRTCFVAGAVVENTVAEGVRDYWQQHLRWARNVWSTAGARPGPRRAVPLRRRIDAALSATGYVDRLIFVSAVGLVSAGRLGRWLPGMYLAVAAAEVVTGVAKAGVPRRAPRYLLSTAMLFPLDVVASAAAIATHLARRPRAWRSASREHRAAPEALNRVEQRLAGQPAGVRAREGAGSGGDIGDPR
jgi:cellulose synthase/poly-beta-1,6-N-acetylglucosamine synthase-like glycosyltransferase